MILETQCLQPRPTVNKKGAELIKLQLRNDTSNNSKQYMMGLNRHLRRLRNYFEIRTQETRQIAHQSEGPVVGFWAYSVRTVCRQKEQVTQANTHKHRCVIYSHSRLHPQVTVE